jgi:hypothetical protein
MLPVLPYKTLAMMKGQALQQILNCWLRWNSEGMKMRKVLSSC